MKMGTRLLLLGSALLASCSGTANPIDADYKDATGWIKLKKGCDLRVLIPGTGPQIYNQHNEENATVEYRYSVNGSQQKLDVKVTYEDPDKTSFSVTEYSAGGIAFWISCQIGG